jgi:hypothetical protein
LRLTWEIRPIRKKKFTTVVTAKVTELTEEHHSGSMNTYYLPRFIYEIDGEEKAFSPHKAYRPCPLKLDSEVTLCISKKGKFRTIRQNVSAVKAAAFIVSGILLTVSQLNNIPVVISIALTAAGIILLILQELIRKSRSSKNKQKLAS